MKGQEAGSVLLDRKRRPRWGARRHTALLSHIRTTFLMGTAIFTCGRSVHRHFPNSCCDQEDCHNQCPYCRFQQICPDLNQGEDRADQHENAEKDFVKVCSHAQCIISRVARIALKSVIYVHAYSTRNERRRAQAGKPRSGLNMQLALRCNDRQIARSVGSARLPLVT